MQGTTSHVEAKKYFRFFYLVDQFHQINTSGLYTETQLKSCVKFTTTVRRDLKDWELLGLLLKRGHYIKLHKMSGRVLKMFRLYQQRKDEILLQPNPAVFFADLLKRSAIRAAVKKQAMKEADKIHDTVTRRKYLKIVGHGRTSIGAMQGINLSVETIAKIFGRTKATGHRYITRMNSSRVIRVKKHSRAICHQNEIAIVRKTENLYGRVFIKDGFVYERLANSYQFN